MLNIYSLSSVSQRVFEKSKAEGYCTAEAFNGDVRKKYKGYFYEIAEALQIKDEMSKLQIRKDRYLFTKEGADSLAELLYMYEKSRKSDDEKNTTKKLEKQLFQNDQYNAFIPMKVMEQYEDMIAGNNLVIMAIECFYKLFLDKGLSEIEVEKIMSKADRKYSYSKRKGFQEILEIFGWYINQLDSINKDRHRTIGITERENAIWLEYANAEIKRQMENVIYVRSKMTEIVIDEVGNEIFSAFYSKEAEMIEDYKKKEIELISNCSSNTEIVKLLNKYNMLTNKIIKLEDLVSFVLVNDEDTDSLLEQLILREVLEVPSDGNNILTKSDTKEIEKTLYSLLEHVKKESEKYMWNLTFQERTEQRTKDKDLLQMAIEEVKSDEEKVHDEKFGLKNRIHVDEIPPTF